MEVSEDVRAYIASLYAALGGRDPIVVMGETPVALSQAVAGLSAGQLATRERAGKWSVLHVLHHLADSELVGGFRFRMALAHDRPALPAYDQDLWADRLHYDEGDAAESTALFAALRGANLRLLERATPEERRRAMRHQERGDVVLDDLIAQYAGHDIVHRRQIARIREAIGAA